MRRPPQHALALCLVLAVLHALGCKSIAQRLPWTPSGARDPMALSAHAEDSSNDMTYDSQALGTQTVDSQSHGSQALGSQSYDSESINSESINAGGPAARSAVVAPVGRASSAQADYAPSIASRQQAGPSRPQLNSSPPMPGSTVLPLNGDVASAGLRPSSQSNAAMDGSAVAPLAASQETVGVNRQPTNALAANATQFPANATQPFAPATARSTAPAGIPVYISGVQPGAGNIKIAVFSAPTGFPDSRSASSTFEVAADANRVKTQVVMAEQLAVAAYQDVNRDGQLNKNRFGIPTEPYGFTNSVRSQRGPPSFEQAVIRRAPQNRSPITVHLQ